MPANPILAADALARGIAGDFRNTWQKRYQGLQAELGNLMKMGMQSDKFEELYGYYEVAPYPRSRRFGDAVENESFRARNYAVENLSWDIAVEWKKEDRLFDQLKGLEAAARRAGENFATLPERVLFQIIEILEGELTRFVGP